MGTSCVGISYYICCGCGEWEDDESGGALFEIDLTNPFDYAGYFCKECYSKPRGFFLRLKARWIHWRWQRALATWWISYRNEILNERSTGDAVRLSCG